MRRALFALEVRLWGEAKRHMFLVRAEEADGLTVLRVPRHAIPRGRLERRRAAQDERVEAPSDGDVGRRHRGDLREHRISVSVFSSHGPRRAAVFFAAGFTVFDALLVAFFSAIEIPHVGRLFLCLARIRRCLGRGVCVSNDNRRIPHDRIDAVLAIVL